MNPDSIMPDARAKRRMGYALIALTIIAFALAVRFANLGYDSLGHDEAIRANRTHHGPIADGRWIPPLKFLMLRAIQHNISRSEWALRLPYALAGVACVIALFAFARRFIDHGAALIIAALAASHPVLVHYARSIKVFSLEALAAVLICWIGYEAYRRRTPAALASFTVAAIVCVGFTFTGALVAAAWMPILGWQYLRTPNGERRYLAAYAAASVALTIAAGGTYIWLTGATTLTQMKSYYDTQELAWPAAYSMTALTAWLAESVKGAALYILGVIQDWPPLSWCAATLQILAVGMSLGFLWRRCRPLCIVLCILAVEAVIAAALRIWPLGKIRHVTYLIPLASIFIGCGLWQFTRRFGFSPATVGLLVLCVGLPAYRSVQTTLIAPHTSEHLRPVIEHVRANVQPGDALFVYYGASDAFEYYADIPETLRPPDDQGPPRYISVRWNGCDVPVLVQPRTDRQNEPAFADRFDAWIARHERVWFIFAHNWKDERRQWVARLGNHHALVDERLAENASAHLFERVTAVASGNAL